MSQAIDRLSTALANRYRIEREVGQGGMAMVYLAHDVRHDRKVALKVLKPELAAVLGAERFVHEIKTTASLSHPHILPLFDSGTADGFLFYVMPFIDGETLRDQLNRETQLGVEEAVRIASEVADALDYAHRHGVIHRDIKPENILLHDGRPMVADFGIALAVSAAAGGRMTETGLSLGTPHYMSPEQATAEKDLTPRSDIYSLATVLYEMLTGNPPHTGSSAQQIIMKIITEAAAPVTHLRKSVPAHVAAAIAKALEKLPADRFASAKAFAAALDDPRFAHGAVTGIAPATMGSGVSGIWGTRRAVTLGAALALTGLLISGWSLTRDPPRSIWPMVPLTLDVQGANVDLQRFGVSPDGSMFAFETDEGIAIRDAGQREYRIFPGTVGGEAPSFSPDGKWILFHSRGELRRIAVTGGAALALIKRDSILAGRPHWGADGTIAFEAEGTIFLISAEGGNPRKLPNAVGGASPRLLPDGSGLLYVDTREGSKLMLYDFANDETTVVLEESSEGQYLPSGHIVYGHPNGGLFAVPFDLASRKVNGPPIPVVNDLQVSGSVSPFEISRSGMLVYRAGLDPTSRLLLRDVTGRIDTLPLAPRVLGYVRFSPDGRRLAMTIGSARGVNRNTSIYDLALGTMTPFTIEGGGHAPVWSPDGSRLAFTAESPDGSAEDIYVQPVDRSRAPVRIAKLPTDQHGNAWPRDDLFVFSDGGSPRLQRSGGDLRLADPNTQDGPTRDYLAANWSESNLAVSPDGAYAAYSSDESGSREVYVRRFPAASEAGQWKVSNGGGDHARWSPDGRTLYYQWEGAIHAVAVRTEPTFTVGARRVVMTVPGMGSAWDVDPKSGRLIVAQAVNAEQAKIVVLVNFLDWLRVAATGAK